MNNLDTLHALLTQPLPQSNRTDLTYCKPNKADMEKWLADMSLLNMADISKQLRTTIVEIGELDISENKRLELAELARIAVHNLTTSLNKNYINQAVVLDQRSINIANFVQHLRAHCFSVYYTIAERMHSEDAANSNAFTSLFKRENKSKALSIHRALTELTGLLYETNLLYLPDIKSLWQRLHSLYKLARKHKSLDARFNDPTGNYGQSLSVAESYMRAILLSISRTNRLRQSEIKKLYEYTELWAPLIKFDKSPHANDLFLIDLGSDTAPMYITTSNDLTGDIIYINASSLLTHLKNLKDSNEGDLLHHSEKMLFRTNMVDFVANSIEEPLERNFARHAYEGKLSTCVGLLGTHYHIAGARHFSDVIQLKHLVKQEEEAEILIDKSRHYHDGDLMFNQLNDAPKIDRTMLGVHQVDIVDMSPGGYRVAWQGISAPTLRTGEIMCLKEANADKWQVGIIRWVQQNPGVGADFGIEVVSTKGTACGVKPARPEDTGSEYMRAILLPEVKSLNRSATLITPNFHFKPNHRIKIRVGNDEVIAKIGKEHISTQSFNQYDFTMLANASTKTYH